MEDTPQERKHPQASDDGGRIGYQSKNHGKLIFIFVIFCSVLLIATFGVQIAVLSTMVASFISFLVWLYVFVLSTKSTRKTQ